jgi:ATP-dependent DNA ligase
MGISARDLVPEPGSSPNRRIALDALIPNRAAACRHDIPPAITASTRFRVPPSGPAWLHEIKHDGYRLMARLECERTRLFSRRGHDWSERFPRIRDALTSLKAQSATIDGEAVVCFREPCSPTWNMKTWKEGSFACAVQAS